MFGPRSAPSGGKRVSVFDHRQYPWVAPCARSAPSGGTRVRVFDLRKYPWVAPGRCVCACVRVRVALYMAACQTPVRAWVCPVCMILCPLCGLPRGMLADVFSASHHRSWAKDPHLLVRWGGEGQCRSLSDRKVIARRTDRFPADKSQDVGGDRPQRGCKAGSPTMNQTMWGITSTIIK